MAEAEYQRARVDDDVTRFIRDSAIVEAHRAGMSSRMISELVGDIGQPNVVRARAGGPRDERSSPVDCSRLPTRYGVRGSMSPDSSGASARATCGRSNLQEALEHFDPEDVDDARARV